MSRVSRRKMNEQSSTRTLIDAVFNGRTTAGGPEELAHVVPELRTGPQPSPGAPVTTPGAPTGRAGRVGVKSGLGAIMATTAGKVLLFTAAAAASVGGAYATNAVGVLQAPTPPPPAWAEDPDDAPSDGGQVVVDEVHGSEVADFVATTELEGCERGQQIAELAAANAADHRRNGERDHDPCAASAKNEDRGVGEGQPGRRGENGAGTAPGRPADPGKPAAGGDSSEADPGRGAGPDK